MFLEILMLLSAVLFFITVRGLQVSAVLTSQNNISSTVTIMFNIDPTKIFSMNNIQHNG